jgi:hypothetical protein
MQLTRFTPSDRIAFRFVARRLASFASARLRARSNRDERERFQL